MVDERFCIDDCCKRRSLGRIKEHLVLRAERKSGRKYKNDGSELLGLNNMLLRLLASFVLFWSQRTYITLSAQLAYFSSQPEDHSLVCFYRECEHTSRNCCREPMEVPAELFLKS